mgnify:CR=1 FL=1
MAEFSVSGKVEVEVTIVEKVRSKVEDQIKKPMSMVEKANKGLTMWVNTLQKALISMIGVVIAWNLIIKPIELAFQGIAKLVAFIAKGINEIQERSVAMAAVIATTADFGGTVEQNFKRAGSVGNAVISELMLRTKELVGSFEDAFIVMQTLLSTGAARYVKTWGELVDVTILLTNAIVTITTGQERQRQLASETAALMTGQVRATDRLAKILGLTGESAKRLRDEWERSKNMAEKLQVLLGGFAQASKQYETLVRSMADSLRDLIVYAAQRGMRNVYGVVTQILQKVYDFLMSHMDSVAAGFKVLGSVVTNILNQIIALLKVAFGIPDVSLIENIFRITYLILGLLSDIINSLTITVGTLRLIYAYLTYVFNLIRHPFVAIISPTKTVRDAVLNAFKLKTIWESMKKETQLHIEVEDLDFVAEMRKMRVMLGDVNDDYSKFLEQTIRARFVGEMEEAAAKVRETFLSMINDIRKQRINLLLQLMPERERVRWESVSDFADRMRDARKELEKAGVPASMLSTELAKIASRSQQLVNLKLEIFDTQRLREARDMLRDLQLQLLEMQGADTATERLRIQFAALADNLKAAGSPEALRALESIQGMIRSIGKEAEKQRLEDFMSKFNTLAKEMPIPLPPGLAPSFGEIFEEDITRLGERMLERIRLIRRGIIPPEMVGNVDQIVRKLEEALKREESIYSITGEVTQEYLKILNTLDAINDELRRQVEGASDIAQEKLKDQWLGATQAMITFRDEATKVAATVGDAFKYIGYTIQTGLTIAISQLGVAFGQFLTDLFSGDEAIKNLRRFVGNILITFGQLAVNLGTMAVLASLIPIFGPIIGNPGAGVALIAAGAAMIALGSAMGGRKAAGGASAGAGTAPQQQQQTILLNQAQIDVNQAIVSSTNKLNNTTAALTTLVDRLAVEDEGVLVKKGTSKLGGTANMLNADLNKNSTAGRTLGTAMAGRMS